MRRSTIAAALLLSGVCAAAAAESKTSSEGPPSSGDVQSVVQRVDRLLAQHWARLNVTPAGDADDATILRRLTLDLAGRIPTREEWLAYRDEPAADKREGLVDRLLTGPEFPLHLANVLDAAVQGRDAGDGDFLSYLRRALDQRRGWDEMYRNMLVGPWETDEQKQADRFLTRRVKDLDRMSTDAARAFFGVDISCAKCHDHPLVIDWSQDHYYGMLSFFSRTTGGKGGISEKKQAEVKFLAGGQEKTARMMFLTGQTFDDAAAPQDADKEDKKEKGEGEVLGGRRQLVEASLAERSFFSRNIANRLWHYFFGRGLVQPVDQMHSENEPAIPELLALLADDLVEHDYDLRRTIRILVSSRVYRLDSRWTGEEPPPSAEVFAVARLRPLSRRQLALSLLLASGDDSFRQASQPEERAKAWLELQAQGEALIASLDQRVDGFESSAGEALFLTNSEAIQKLLRDGDHSLAKRLSAVDDDGELVTAVYQQLLSRDPTDAEVEQLTHWINTQRADRESLCADLAWAVLTSAEFRFLP
ncbi:MAG: DUF1553 domain-containing protein [Pirellulaceae bacterium]